MLGGTSNFKLKRVQNPGQRRQFLFTGAKKNMIFASGLCKICRSKHLSTFVEVVEGSLIYNFAIYHLVHFSFKIWSTSRSNSASQNNITMEHDVAPRHRVPALQNASPRVAATTPPCVVVPRPARGTARA
jgi:hypothetical protein